MCTPIALKNNESENESENEIFNFKISERNIKYLNILSKVEETLLWYLTPIELNDEQIKLNNEKYINLPIKQQLKQKEKDFEIEWKSHFNLNIFVSSNDKISIVLYEGYDELMNDVLMKFFDLRKIIGTDYDKINQNISENNKNNKCFKIFRKIINKMFIFIIGPMQLLLAIYSAIIYPILISIILIFSYNKLNGKEKALFWFIKAYYIIIIFMLIF